MPDFQSSAGVSYLPHALSMKEAHTFWLYFRFTSSRIEGFYISGAFASPLYMLRFHISALPHVSFAYTSFILISLPLWNISDNNIIYQFVLKVILFHILNIGFRYDDNDLHYISHSFIKVSHFSKICIEISGLRIRGTWNFHYWYCISWVRIERTLRDFEANEISEAAHKKLAPAMHMHGHDKKNDSEKVIGFQYVQYFRIRIRYIIAFHSLQAYKP